MGFDYSGLFVRGSLFLGLSELLDQTQGLALEAAVETPTDASLDNLIFVPIWINCTVTGRREAIHTSTSCKKAGGQLKEAEITSRRITDLLVAEIQELLELNATVREGTESSFFLELSGELGIGSVSHGWYVKWGREMWMMWCEEVTGCSGELYSRSGWW